MQDLVQSQIKESCKLALPNGLKELMSDMSREVIRAQPKDLYNFITKYLSSLLVIRDNLAIATQLCNSICECSCRPELEEELQYIGFDEEEAIKIAAVIAEQFAQGTVNEANLLVKISEKVEIDIDMIPYIQEAIRTSFLLHQANHNRVFESSSDSDPDDTAVAVKRTLRLYRKSNPSVSAYTDMATKLESSYRAYKVQCDTGFSDNVYQDDTPSGSYGGESSSRRFKNCRVSTASSISLAGSFLSLPKHTPYSAHDLGGSSLGLLKEYPETENINYDYTDENDKSSRKGRKKIGFDDNSTIKEFDSNIALHATKESDTSDLHSILEDDEDMRSDEGCQTKEVLDNESVLEEEFEYHNIGTLSSALEENYVDEEINGSLEEQISNSLDETIPEDEIVERFSYDATNYYSDNVSHASEFLD